MKGRLSSLRGFNKFEVGSWLEKNNRLWEQGAVRPLTWGCLGACFPRNFWNPEAMSSILGTKLIAKDKGRLLINSNIFLYFYNTNKLKMADLLTKREGCICARKRPVTFLIFHPFVSFVFLGNHLTVLGKKKHTRIVSRPARQMAETVIRSISCSLQLGRKSNENKNMVIKRWNGRLDIIIFL